MMPYRYLAIGIAALAYTVFIFFAGWKECSVREQAKQRDQALAYAKMITDEQMKGEKLSEEIRSYHEIIIKRAEERKKDVTKVTTGRECFNTATIRLLRNETSETETSSGANAEGSREVATDTDLANWAIESQTQYGICAKRLNELINWFE